ncbi:serine hydrolase [Cyclobacterium jeungdonense]|uniref:serine hydrolase n=1 Tax=Cyclobacterium jeungdonense TaxID=708087 RepID=UPI00293BDFF0|nr:serine hydrolase [Cyclobacterium jeungdonense]
MKVPYTDIKIFKKRHKNQRIFRIVLLVGTPISLYLVPWTLLFAWMAPLPNTVGKEVRAALKHDFDGILVYVDREGADPEYYPAGWHNREAELPARPDALFKIASIGKLYDAVLITKLISAQRLSLDKTLVDYFPELLGRMEHAETITIHMLVQHRSRIPNVTDTPDFWINPPKSSGEALERVLDLPADFEPGTAYAYSNTNYLLLTELIEKVLGYGKFQYMQEQILLPLGLKNTFGSLQEVYPEELMSGYYVGVEEDIKMTDYGSMIATAEDVGIFLRALNEGSLFTGDEQEIYSSINVYEHTGRIPGYQSTARYHKEINTVVIQFVNTTNFDGYTWSLSEITFNRIGKILPKRLGSWSEACSGGYAFFFFRASNPDNPIFSKLRVHLMTTNGSDRIPHLVHHVDRHRDPISAWFGSRHALGSGIYGWQIPWQIPAENAVGCHCQCAGIRWDGCHCLGKGGSDVSGA